MTSRRRSPTSIAGKTATKAVTRQPFGNAPANAPHDYGDIWWNPAESGWGLTLNHHGDNLFGVWYTYDANEQPLWIVMPGGTFSGNTFTGKLYTTTGSPFDQPFVAANTKVTEVGTATIVFEGATARFTATVLGVTRSTVLSRLPFGTASRNKAPTVSLAVSGAPATLVAPVTFTLEASASDADGRVRKVAFFKNHEKVGETATAPYRMSLAGIEAGKVRFSAQVTDDLGATSLATSAAFEVKKPGTSVPPPAANKPPKVALTAPAAKPSTCRAPPSRSPRPPRTPTAPSPRSSSSPTPRRWAKPRPRPGRRPGPGSRPAPGASPPWRPTTGAAPRPRPPWR